VKLLEKALAGILNDEIELSSKADFTAAITELFQDQGEEFDALKQELMAGVDDERQDNLLQANFKISKWLWNLVNASNSETGQGSLNIICASADSPSYQAKSIVEEHFEQTFNPFVLFCVDPAPSKKDKEALIKEDGLEGDEDLDNFQDGDFDSLFVSD